MIVFELIPMLVGTIVGAVIKLQAKKLEIAQQREMALLKAAAATIESMDHAAERGKNFAWTKRFLAIGAMFSIILWPIIFAPLFDISVTHGFTEVVSGFWPFTEDKSVLKWHEVKGVVLTPLHTTIMTTILGYFFGSDIAKHGR